MVDVTDIPEAGMGMEVTLFGRDGDAELPLEVLCELSGRFNYEFVCDINKRVPRIYSNIPHSAQINLQAHAFVAGN